MPKLTWLGDAECVWNDVTFPVGVPVAIDDPYMLGKAKHSPFFRVEDDASRIMPETWTNTPPGPFPDFPPDYPPEDDPDRLPLKRKRGRPPKVRINGDQ